ncbi:MAG TPA: hypothetical protein VGB49_05340 [Caulobacteraceae bacterium]|jgi:hypothetical protein
MRRLTASAVLTLAVAVAGCDVQPAGKADAPARPTQAAPAAASQPAPAREPPAQPNGPAVAVMPATDEAVPSAASVTQVQMVEGQDAKVFSTAGGDPAANGLYTYLALFDDPAEGWRVFGLGDFSSWEISEQATGRIVLKVGQDSAAPATGNIRTTPGRIIVTFTTGEAPVVTMTPAR